MIKVTYDAGDNSLSSNNLIPGQTLTKTFTVTVTPTAKENTASYSIYLDLTNNTFVKCDDSNYNSITNACIQDYEELTYEFKDNTGAILSSGNLIGESGRILLAAETKTVDRKTTYEYTMEITFHETNADQNHNMDKVLNGSIEVEFGVVGSDYILASENAPTSHTTDWTGEESYYYTGNPNNWVSFAGFYWRIIRINGDGSIRMIYQGVADSTTPDSDNTTGAGTQIQTSAFNSSTNNNAYVGYMYTSGEVHGTGSSSTIKGVLDTWYNTYIENEQSNIHYGQYIDGNAGFCGDRTLTSGSGTGTSTTYYTPYTRMSNNIPSLACQVEDIYTTYGSENGNRALMYPIGLISADEAMFAGIPNWNSANTGSYLYTGQNYWTMSPSHYPFAHVFTVASDGYLNASSYVDNAHSVRPVINLKSNVSITGSGTIDDPFKLALSPDRF